MAHERIRHLGAYWRATPNYLRSAQLYLKENGLLREPLRLDIVDHWELEIDVSKTVVAPIARNL